MEEKLSAQTAVIIELVDSIKTKMSKDEKIIFDPEFKPPKMPFSDVGALNDFERNLESSTVFDQMVNKFFKYTLLFLLKII